MSEWLIFHVSILLPYISTTIILIYLILRLVVWANTLNDLIVVEGQGAVFHNLVIFPHILFTFIRICIILKLMVWIDTVNDLIRNLNQCDPYFMFH